MLLGLASSSCAFGAEIRTPAVRDPQLELTLFTAEPDIMTPIGIAVDKHGRIFIVESHTHFPKKDYPGPKYDRIKIFEDTDKDAKPDKISIFADGLYHSMNLAFAPDGQLYLTHRNGVMILHDQDGDGVSESRTTVLQLETRGDYPHDGISAIAFSPDGWLYIGMGENLGEKYTLKGSDGSSHSGGGEGGNVFRCRPDGSQLQQIATGFWNLFALEFDRAGHLFAVDNDPDSRPPCRLLHVVEGGDYGYKFRYGRSGLHPFTCWNGELPGTLPMVAGTGEAPSGILDCNRASLPVGYRGALLVTSWGDHYLELYRPIATGPSFRAERKIIAEGDEWFRPVGIAAAPDGTVYITDWVDVDYSVHGKGRIWRLFTKPGIAAIPVTPLSSKSRRHPAEERMQTLMKANSLRDYNLLIRSLADGDPFLRSAAITALARPVFRQHMLGEIENGNPAVRLGALLALRRANHENPASLLSKMLADPDERIRLMALVWAAEEKLTVLADRLKVALSAGPVSPALFRTYSAAAETLAKTKPAGSEPVATAVETSKTPVRTLVMTMAIKHYDVAAIELLSKPGRAMPLQLRLEAVRALAEMPGDKANTVLLKTALDKANPSDLRAEAVLALAGQPADVLARLIHLLDDHDSAVQIETARAFRPAAADARIRAALQQTGDSVRGNPRHALLAAQLQFTLHPPGTARPASDDDWRKVLAVGGDASAGRRVFFHPAVGCARCHRIEDHGGQIGPDLSTITRSADREKLMRSILHPSREIAPQYVLHTVATKDSETWSGLLLGQGADGSITLTTADGKGVLIPANQIASRNTSTISLMPEGLQETLTPQDFSDLMAFLLSLK